MTKQASNTKSPLKGLILSGGKSTRMGEDKSVLQFHRKPQREYLFDLASEFCDEVFYSLRPEQEELNNDQVIYDSEQVNGPFNGLLSAHRSHPKAAWLVLACDLPLMDRDTLELLISARNPQMDATALATSSSGLPEPLAAIWEPSAIEKAVGYLEVSNSTCPRKFLLQPQTQTKLVTPESDDVLLNANSPEDVALAIQKISSV